MANVLVFGLIENGRLSSTTLEAVRLGSSLAEALGCSIHGALFGSGIEEPVRQFASTGLSRLYVADDSRLGSYVGEVMVTAAEALVRESGADLVLFPTDANATEWVPRLAARMGASLVGSCVGARVEDGRLLATRAISGGALQAEYTFNTELRMLLLAPGFEPGSEGVAECEIVTVALPQVESRVELLEIVPDEIGTGPQLKNARIVVSGGLGMGAAEHWILVEEAASALGAAVGATRAAVELGLAPPAKQVGFSGVKVGPDLYIAIGISGALHHLAGISRAKKVVAINNDPEANIFKAAHIGVVGDAKEVVPAFINRVRELSSSARVRT